WSSLPLVDRTGVLRGLRQLAGLPAGATGEERLGLGGDHAAVLVQRSAGGEGLRGPLSDTLGAPGAIASEHGHDRIRPALVLGALAAGLGPAHVVPCPVAPALSHLGLVVLPQRACDLGAQFSVVHRSPSLLRMSVQWVAGAGHDASGSSSSASSASRSWCSRISWSASAFAPRRTRASQASKSPPSVVRPVWR